MPNDHDDRALRFDPAVYRVALARMECAPLELTPSDLDQIAIISTHLHAVALDAQHKAQLALPPKTAARPAGTTPRERERELIADGVVALLKDVLKVRDEQIAALHDRVLQLEAVVASLQGVTRDAR